MRYGSIQFIGGSIEAVDGGLPEVRTGDLSRTLECKLEIAHTDGLDCHEEQPALPHMQVLHRLGVCLHRFPVDREQTLNDTNHRSIQYVQFH